MAEPRDNISESLADMKKFNNSRSGMDKVQAAFLGKTYDSFYNKQSTYEENRVNATGAQRGLGFGKRDEEDDPDKPGIFPDKKLSKNVKSKNRKSSKSGRGRKSLKGVKGFNAIFAIKDKRKNGSRQATSGDIKRAGISALKRVNASLARFIAARYSAKAIAKYQDYAGRLRRSKRLIKQIVEINANTFRIKGYIIQTDTAGNNPYSCTCPDFSQVSQDARVWLGSKAGPFNPCKHMMAVRDRSKAGRWICSGGVCVLDTLEVAPNGYATKAECEASVCANCNTPGMPTDTWVFITRYIPFGETEWTIRRIADVRYSTNASLIGELFYSTNQYWLGAYDTNYPNIYPAATAIGSSVPEDYEINVFNCMTTPKLGCTNPSAINFDRSADTDDGSCTYNYGCTDPSATNYDPDATIDDGSCTYGVYGCTDSGATNYNPDATIDDGSCTY